MSSGPRASSSGPRSSARTGAWSISSWTTGWSWSPINPKALDRAPERYRVSPSKSDPFDARVLASFLRTDQAHLQALQPSSDAEQEPKLLTRDADRLVREQTRLVNQLTATRKAYDPRARELCGDVTAKRTAALTRDQIPKCVGTHRAVEVRGEVRRTHLKRAGQKQARVRRLGSDR